MVGDMKPFTERQKQLAKPFRPWSEILINLLNNMKIQLQSISTMVGGTNPLVGGPNPLVGGVLTLVGIVLTLVGGTYPLVRGDQTLVSDTTALAER
jgi:hypothetical protein